MLCDRLCEDATSFGGEESRAFGAWLSTGNPDDEGAGTARRASSCAFFPGSMRKATVVDGGGSGRAKDASGWGGGGETSGGE